MDTYLQKLIIAEAGRHHKLIKVVYKGEEKLLEPYSYRPGPKEERFYAFCLEHQQIHSFLLSRFESIQITDLIYVPRWNVEV